MNILCKTECGAGLNPRHTPFSLCLDEYPLISASYSETSVTLWYMIYAQNSF